MSARIQVTLQDGTGIANTTADVDLYDNAGTTKIGDFTNNGDGTYYFDLTTSNKYRVKVDGTDQDEFTGKMWVTEDIKTHMDAAAPHSGHTTDAELTAVKGSGWSTETVKGNADDITTIKGTGWTSEDIKTNADAITAMKGTGWTSLMTLVKMGDMNLTGLRLISGAADVTEALRILARQVWENFTSSGSSGGSSADYVIFTAQYASTVIGQDGSFRLFFEMQLKFDIVLEWVQVLQVGTPAFPANAWLRVSKSSSAGSYSWDSNDEVYAANLTAAGYVASAEDEAVSALQYIGIGLKLNNAETQSIQGSVTLVCRKTGLVTES